MKLGLGLIIIVVGQLMFLCFFLFSTKQGKLLSNRLLGTFFLLLALNLIDLLLKYNGYDSYYRSLALVDDAFVLLYGPLIYLYSYSVIYKDVHWKTSWWWHFVPFVLLAGFMLLAQNLQPQEVQTQLLEDIEQGALPQIILVLMSLTFLHPLIYLMICFRMLRRYRLAIRQRFSNVSSIDLKWLDFTLWSVLLLLLIAALHAAAPAVLTRSYVYLSLLLMIIWLLFFVNRWLWKALKYSGLFEGIARGPDEKYQGSTLSIQERERLASALELHLQQDKPYLDSDLTIDQLAQSVNVTPKILSQVINQSYGKHFFEWINEYRIREAQKMLIERPQATVLEILYQCGYNSKSSFNNFFKRITGTTPSKFRAQQKNP